MRYLLILLCILMLIGCNDSTTETDTAQTQASIETTAELIKPAETLAPVVEMTEKRNPFDFIKPGALWENHAVWLFDETERAAFADAIGDPLLNDTDELYAFLQPFFALTVPEPSDFGATFIENMIWDPHTETVTLTYTSSVYSPEYEQTVHARLVHDLAADADEIRTVLDADGNVTPLMLNGTADAIYLHRDDPEALKVTVIKYGQVMYLMMYGEDTELRMARLADTDFTYSVDTYGIADDGMPYELAFASADDIKRLFSVPSMTDAEFEAYSMEDSRFMNGLVTREHAALVTNMLSRVSLPCLDGDIAIDTVSVRPEPGLMQVFIPIVRDGIQVANVIFDLRGYYHGVTALYLSRLKSYDWISDRISAWMPIDEDMYCAQVDDMYVQLYIFTPQDITPEQITFGPLLTDWIAQK